MGSFFGWVRACEGIESYIAVPSFFFSWTAMADTINQQTWVVFEIQYLECCLSIPNIFETFFPKVYCAALGILFKVFRTLNLKYFLCERLISIDIAVAVTNE